MWLVLIKLAVFKIGFVDPKGSMNRVQGIQDSKKEKIDYEMCVNCLHVSCIIPFKARQSQNMWLFYCWIGEPLFCFVFSGSLVLKKSFSSSCFGWKWWTNILSVLLWGCENIHACGPLVHINWLCHTCVSSKSAFDAIYTQGLNQVSVLQALLIYDLPKM